jgi:hypothetical protein
MKSEYCGKKPALPHRVATFRVRQGLILTTGSCTFSLLRVAFHSFVGACGAQKVARSCKRLGVHDPIVSFRHCHAREVVSCWGSTGFSAKRFRFSHRVPRSTPRHPGVPRGTLGYPGIPRGTSWYLGVHRGTSGYLRVPQGTPFFAKTLSRRFRTVARRCSLNSASDRGISIMLLLYIGFDSAVPVAALVPPSWCRCPALPPMPEARIPNGTGRTPEVVPFPGPELLVKSGLL